MKAFNVVLFFIVVCFQTLAAEVGIIKTKQIILLTKVERSVFSITGIGLNLRLIFLLLPPAQNGLLHGNYNR